MRNPIAADKLTPEQAERLNEMDLEVYEAALDKFDTSPGALWYYALGLAGESGESVDMVKKLYRDGMGRLTPLIANTIAFELGDALWYLTRLSNKLGFSLREIMLMNIDKLSTRRANRA